MSIEENKAIVQRYVEAFDRKDGEVMDSTVAAELSPRWGRAVLARNAHWGEHRLAITDMIAEGDKVWIRLATSGVHIGDYLGIPPTGKRWTNRVVAFFRIEGDKVVELDALPDVWNQVQQLGATLTPPAAQRSRAT